MRWPTCGLQKIQMSKRGFAAMAPEKQRQIASKGGKAAHGERTAHKFTSETASAAGKKGSLSVSKDRAYMSAIGKKGITKRWENYRLDKLINELAKNLTKNA